MATNLDKFKKDFNDLLELGEKIYQDVSYRGQQEMGRLDETAKKKASAVEGSFEVYYQKWYTEAHALIKQLIPDRLAEFEQLYKGDGKRKEINGTTYTIQDWLNGVRASVSNYDGKKRFGDFAGASMRFSTQYEILQAVEKRFSSSLFDIRLIAQADLFDSELEAAKELIKHGFIRAAGVIAGVVLEKHLSQVMVNHGVSLGNQSSTIGNMNDVLKSKEVLGVPQWRNVQRLGDLRNLCAHDNDREPDVDEAKELISGVEKITKTLF